MQASCEVIFEIKVWADSSDATVYVVIQYFIGARIVFLICFPSNHFFFQFTDRISFMEKL